MIAWYFLDLNERFRYIETVVYKIYKIVVIFLQLLVYLFITVWTKISLYEVWNCQQFFKLIFSLSAKKDNMNIYSKHFSTISIKNQISPTFFNLILAIQKY